MRYEYVVRPVAGRWKLTRGATAALWFPRCDAALGAAETFAAAVGDQGDLGVVLIETDEGLKEHRSFSRRPVDRVALDPTPPRWRNIAY